MNPTSSNPDPNNESQKYKTISSEEDTRHPTSNKKKIQYTPLQ